MSQVAIRLHNSKSRKVEDFVPLDPQNVRMYVCGPTVYDRAHLGNARPVVVFDLLYRLLRLRFGDKKVKYVRNFTDVDDKINAEALRRQKAGASGTLEELIRERTEETIKWYHEDMDALGAQRPNVEPRATAYIGQMIAMCADLISKGHAYAAEGHVLFRVRSYKDYGALSGRSVDDMIAGARVEVAPFKEDPMDFVLWKPSDDETPGWESPWGRGRPGWHIECSAMAYKILGPSFDIHGGGIDLQFPHHENEIAQSCCAHPEGQFARYWMHNEMLLVEGKKMSKSLGNFFTVRDLLNQGYTGNEIRFVFMGTHYRKPMDWTHEKAMQARETLWKWRKEVELFEDGYLTYYPEVIEALADDLNTAAVIAALHKRFAAIKTDEDRGHFRSVLRFLGLDKDWSSALDQTLRHAVAEVGGSDEVIGDYINALQAARAEKDWTTADALKTKLSDAGLIVKINRDGIEWERGPHFDGAKLM